MKIVLRLDLDYVPWDAFSHDEPAAFVRLLELGRQRGLKYHFFASTRSVLTFPSMSDQALNEGHEVDWLAPRQHEPLSQAMEAFRTIGHTLQGGAGPTRTEADPLEWWITDPAVNESTADIEFQTDAIAARHVQVILRATPSQLTAEDQSLNRWLAAIDQALQTGYDLGTMRRK